MRTLKHMLLSTICLLPVLAMTAGPALAGKAGVTAAVNPQAVGTPPGGAVRTIVLGQDVLTDEKIDTTGGGLVQILLADGTTFTVGPNSSLTIDKFVYDPEANTAQVTASLAKGVFRFIGGRTSKTEGGVTINTPVGTVGIRGAVADVSLTPNGQDLKAQIDLLFGKEVTLSGPGGLIDRIYKAGYSILIGGDGKATLVKTPPGSANGIQQALAGKPGTHGGAGDGPSDGQVASSDVPKSNSDQGPPDFTPPDLTAIELATIDFFNGHDDAKQLLDREDEPGYLAFIGTMVADGHVNGIGDPEDLNEDGYAAPTFGYDTLEGGSHLVSGGVYGTDEDSSYHFQPLVGDASYTLAEIENWSETSSVAGRLNGSLDDGPIDQISILQTGQSVTGSVHRENGTSPTVDITLNGYPPMGPLCAQCSFLSWGVWDTEFDGASVNGPVGAVGLTVAGRYAGATVFNKYANDHAGVTATYSGKAIGYESFDGTQAKLATGDLDMNWNFGARTGDVAISNFGDNQYDMSATVNGSGGHFASSGGIVSVEGVDIVGSSFNAIGAFAQNGPDPAAGVMGNFQARVPQDGPYYFVSGIFGGAKELPQ